MRKPRLSADDLSLPDVLARTGWSRATLYRRIATGEFPAAGRLVSRTAYWSAKEINAALGVEQRPLPYLIAMGLV